MNPLTILAWTGALLSQIGPIFPGPGMPAAGTTRSFVQAVTAFTTTGCASPLTRSITVSSGNFIVVGIGSYNAFSAAPTDGTNTYTLVVREQKGSTSAFAEIYTATAAASTTYTISISSCGTWANVVAVEYTNPAAATDTGGNTGTDGLTATIAAPNNGLVVSVGFDQTDGAYTPAVNNSFTLRGNACGGSGNTCFGLADRINVSAGNYSVQWSGWTSTSGFSSIIASF